MPTGIDRVIVTVALACLFGLAGLGAWHTIRRAGVLTLLAVLACCAIIGLAVLGLGECR